MPQGKKNKGGKPRNSKKKRGAGHGKNAHRKPNAKRETKANNARNLPLTPENALSTDTPPDYVAYEESHNVPLHESYPTIYSRYKAATNRVFRYMQGNTPESIHGNCMNVNSLVTAADWMQENQHQVQHRILKDLKLAIRVRSRVAESVFDGGDAGHKHLLSTLVYCWRVLASLPLAPNNRDEDLENETEQKMSLSDSNITATRNRFEALHDEDLDNETETDADLFPTKPVPRPDPQPEPLSLDEIIKSDIRHDSWLFLDSMDALMQITKVHYTSIVEQVLARPQSTAIVEGLIEAAVAMNMGIQQMQRLEAEFELQHPDVTTPYHLLTAFAFPETLLKTMEVLRDHAKKPCSEQEARLFLSECMEHNFRAPSDPRNKRSVLASEFCERYEISDEEGERLIHGIFRSFEFSVPVEVPLSKERASNKWLYDEMKKNDPNHSSHSWIPKDMIFIGGDRAIHHTIRLLQFFGTVVTTAEEGKQLIAADGFFGPKWKPGTSRTIREDMDELLMADILPSWFLLYRDGILGKTDLPRQNELATFWVCMKNYFHSPLEPVRWSTAFAVHAMLSAIFETQSVLDEIVLCSKVSFDMFFEQLDKATLVPMALEEVAFVGENVAIAKYLQNFGRSVFRDRAIWNPLCGGTLLSYIAFFGNLEVGCTLIDECMQLRMSLHLYNALLENKILKRGEVPLMDELYDGFEKSRAIWGGARPPSKGRFVLQFWLSMGSDGVAAAEMRKEAQELIDIVTTKHEHHPTPKHLPIMKVLQPPPIDLSEISTSFRRICQRDFHDVVDNYHTPEQRKRSRGSDYYTLAVQSNDTLDAIDDEQQLFGLNLCACSTYLDFFIRQLSKIFNWDTMLEVILAALDTGLEKRQGVVYTFAQQLLGALDFADDPMDMSIYQVPQGRASSTIMKETLNAIPSHETAWFQRVKGIPEKINFY